MAERRQPGKLNALRMGSSLIAAALCTAAMAQSIRVAVNGKQVIFEAAPPHMVDGRVFVPLRGVFEQMGAKVAWDEASQSITAETHGVHRKHIRLKVGSTEATIDGQVVKMDAAPVYSEESTLVPLRFLSEALGAKVDWEPEQDQVWITTEPDQASPTSETARQAWFAFRDLGAGRPSDAGEIHERVASIWRVDETIQAQRLPK